MTPSAWLDMCRCLEVAWSRFMRPPGIRRTPAGRMRPGAAAGTSTGTSGGWGRLKQWRHRADGTRVNHLNLGSVVDRWRDACAAVDAEGDQAWAEAESASLIESVLAARPPGSLEDLEAPGAASNRGDRLGGVDRATRAWARTQSSLPVLTSRLSRLRSAIDGGGVDALDDDRLDDLCALVVATANEEFTLRLQQAALTDPLTGIGNRRALDNAWRVATIQAKRLGHPACLVAIDLDGLKRINDFQGHAAGDDAIVGLCAALRAALRDTDEVFRIGGDEFVALLPGTAAAAAGELMARVLQFHAPSFSWGAADTIQDGSTLHAVLGCADRRLYAQRRRDRPATTPVVATTPRARPSPWSRVSAKRAVELAVCGGLALAIGAIVVSISGGNHSVCAAGDGPTVVDCGLSNAVYYGGIVLMAAGGMVLGIGVVARALRGSTE